ncbi:hypothetical protein [Anditalea andensis]|nr:hypothetical protein [Anditalea andensis]
MQEQNFLVKSIRSVFIVDLRAIAMMRIALSVILLTDIIFRISDLKAFYSGQGVLPLKALFAYLWNPYYTSLFNLTEHPYLLSVLFAIYAACVFCLLVGYKTKWSTILTWIFLMSLHNRNPLIIQAGDHLLRMMVFWGIFLPWGYLYSFDSLKNIQVKKSHVYESFAGIAYICQIAFLYYFSALLKSSPEWRTDYTAIYYALSLDQLTRPIGRLMYPYYDLMTYMTASVFYIEFFLPLLLFVPFFNKWIRMVIIVAIALLQFGIFLTMNVGLFSITGVVIMIGLIPTDFLDKVQYRFRETIKKWEGAVVRLRLKYISSKEKTIHPPKPVLYSEILVSLALIYVLGWNMQTVGKKVIPDNMIWIGDLFKLHQQWGMFAPSVYKDDGWFIYLGVQENGNNIDLLRDGAPLSMERPELISDLVKNDRWRKYGENILPIDNAHYRPYLCDYLITEWNSLNPEKRIKHLSIIYMLEVTMPDYQTEPVREEHLCYCEVEL